MAQKRWEKSVQVNKDIERFTVGRDREMDLYLAKHDVLGSMAHITTVSYTHLISYFLGVPEYKMTGLESSSVLVFCVKPVAAKQNRQINVTNIKEIR